MPLALVTGAAKGMGLATARIFAGSGAFVVLADVNSDLAAKEVKQIVVEGGIAIGIACDVANEAQVAIFRRRLHRSRSVSFRLRCTTTF